MIKLPINLDELSFVLHRGPELELACFLDLDTGTIENYPTNREALISLLKLDDEKGNLYTTEYLVDIMIPKDRNLISIPDKFSEVIYTIMTHFVRKLDGSEIQLYNELSQIIHQKGDYQLFHEVLQKHPSQLRRFLETRDTFFERSALNWLKEHNISVSSAGYSSSNESY